MAAISGARAVQGTGGSQPVSASGRSRGAASAVIPPSPGVDAWQHPQSPARPARSSQRPAGRGHVLSSPPRSSPPLPSTMPKPTLIQSILNKPSQSYHHPTQRDYHSTRGELFRLAHAAAKVIPGQFDDSGLDTSTPGNSDTETYHSSATFDRSSQRPSSKSRALSSHSGSDLSQSQPTAEVSTLLHSA